jgi:hypothetical protein
MKEKKNIWKEAEDWMEKQINLKKEFTKDFPNTWGNNNKNIEFRKQDITLTKNQIPPPNMSTNFFQVIPNSQIFTTIEQLLEYSKHTDAYLHQGVKNSIKQGYKLIK